jgi:hypothetical protein
MLSFRNIAAVVGVFVSSLALAQDATPAPERLVMFNFDKTFNTALLKNNNGSGALVGNAIRVTAPDNGNWPGVLLKAPNGKWDLSAYEYVSVDIHNIDNHEIEVFVRVDNPGATGMENCISERTSVQPDQRVTMTIPLKRISNSAIKLSGMIGYPQGLFPGKGALDCSNIVAICPFTAKGLPGCVYEISNVYAAGRYQRPAWVDMKPEQFFPFIDKYGQFIHKDWPGKIHSDEELKSVRKTEAKQLASDPGPKEWDKYGGWADGPTLKATGHFRVEKYNNKWWLVDPEGKLFFSTGLCCVGYGSAATPVEQRENWFAGLPPQTDPAGKPFYQRSYKVWSGFYTGKEPLMFDFSRSNLQRKYGPDFRSLYYNVVHQRLRAWGINTIANWSSADLCKMQRTPYTLPFFYGGKSLKSGGGNFPDVFAPDFQANVLKGAKQFLTGTTDDPWCIGYFVDNEMAWGGENTLALYALRAPADQPGKLELIRWLKQRYATPADLAKAWNVKCDSWDAFAAETKLKPVTAQATKDLAQFTDYTAETYFRTMHDVIRQVAPNKLYLGCRCVGGSEQVIATAIKYCDVVSYNRYCHSVLDVKFPGNLDGPMMIGEFHFGASDRGMFWNGLVSCDSQQDRGRKYQDYVRSALDNPQILGVHWFTYGDEAPTGRGDGENAQCGFVDVCDSPYVETTTAARGVADSMYTYRMQSK